MLGKIFTITERIRNSSIGKRDSLVVDMDTSGSKKESDTESNCSDSYWTGKSRVMTLQADSPQVEFVCLNTTLV